MHAVVQDGREVVIEDFWEDELPVDEEKRPENNSNKHSNGEGCGGEQNISEATRLGVEVCQKCDTEEYELKKHVEEGEVLEDASKFFPPPCIFFRKVYSVHLVVHGPGEARDGHQVHDGGREGLHHDGALKRCSRRHAGAEITMFSGWETFRDIQVTML